MRRRSKSNGISSTLRKLPATPSFSVAARRARSTARSSRFFRPGLVVAVEAGVLEHLVRVGADRRRGGASRTTRSCVSVPVLSVHSTSIAPKFWIASSRLTITFLRDSVTAPRASVEVTIIGSISGVRPTAIDSANSNACSQSPLVKPLIRKTIGTITSMKRISSQLTRLMPAWNAVGRGLDVRRMLGQRAEVGVAAGADHERGGRAADHVRAHEAQVRWLPAASSIASRCDSADFSTGSDSPVIADWLTNRSFAASRRRSAGIMSPAASRSTSPGTSCSTGSSTSCDAPPWAGLGPRACGFAATRPPKVASPALGRSGGGLARRNTVARLPTRLRKASAARCERASCTKRISVDSATMARITPAERGSWVSADTAASALSSRLNGLR